jgi:HEAT repeat protein
MRNAVIPRWTAGVGTIMLLSSCATYRPDPAVSAAMESRLQALAAMEYGQDQAPATALSAFVAGQDAAARQWVLEPRLAAFAADASATQAARQHVIRELGRMGTARSAPMLIGMLGDAEFGDDAAMALRRMTDPKVKDLAWEALPTAAGIARERIVAILGDKRVARAVPALASDARGEDPRIAEAAVASLGRIATPGAAGALIAVLPDLAGGPRSAAWEALLSCQDAAHAMGDNETAREVAEAIARGGASAHILAASRAMELAAAAPADAAAGVVAMLASAGPDEQTVGAALARSHLDDAALAAVCEALPRLPQASQLALLGILEDRGLTAAAGLIEERTSSPDEAVRCAALRALGHAGVAGSVAAIAEAAAASSDPVQRAARQALRMVAGPGVDDALRELARTAETAVRLEAMAAIGDRATADATPVVFAAAADPDERVRRAAIRQLGALAGPAEWPLLLAMVVNPAEAGDRPALVAAAGEAAMRIPDSGGSVAAMLASAQDPNARAALLALAGRLGDDAALPELARAAADENPDVRQAALRALAGWKSPAALPALLAATATGVDESSRRLAARGAIQLLRQPGEMPDAERIALYRGLASRLEHPDDQRLLLSAIADAPHPDAFSLAAEFLDQPEVRAEAEAAVRQLADRLGPLDDAQQAVLRRIEAEHAEAETETEANAESPPAPETAPPAS